jgi:hypothetical protein
MITLLSLNFWLNFLYFFIAVIIAFYLPGLFFISRLKVSKFQEIVLSFLLGMVLWGWQGFILGYANLRWASYIYLLFFVLVWLKPRFHELIKVNTFKLSTIKFRIDYVLVFLIIFGVFLQLTSIFLTGVMTSKGLYFCCGTQMDNILQIAITNSIIKNFPPFEPGMFPVIIQNYHYWDSLIMADLIRVFRLPLIATDYQFMTVFISLFLGLSAIVFAQLLRISKVFERWLVFFLYLGGDFVWLLITIYRGRDFFGMNPLESGQQFLENIPRAMAVVVFFAFLSIFILWIKRKDKYSGFLMAIIAASLVGLKVYLGFFALAGLGVLGIYYLLKRQYYLTIPLLLALVLSLLIYIPVNSSAGGLYFTGFWRFENFIVQPYLGDLSRMELARVIYVQHHSWLRVIQYEAILMAVFIFSIFGTKLLAIFQTRKSLSQLPKELNIFLITGFIVSVIIGFFFSQTTGGSNTFNFVVSIFIIGSIYTALSCYYWLNNKWKIVQILFIAIVALFTLPRGLDQAYNNIFNILNNRGFTITSNELSALNFLSSQKTSSLVMVDPKIEMERQAPYISFLTDKHMFLSGQVDELEAHGINFADRLKVRTTVLTSTDPASVSAALLTNNIGYIYMLSFNNLVSTESAIFLKPVFINNEIKILEVNNSEAKTYLINHKKELNK